MSGPDPPQVRALFESKLDLVSVLARRIRRTIDGAVSLDELENLGRAGLLDAARRFDPERGVPFGAYATFRIRGSIIDGVRAAARLPRRAHERIRTAGAANAFSEGAAEDVHARRSAHADPGAAEAGLHEHLAAMATAIATGLLARTARDDSGEPTATATDDPEEAVGREELLSLIRRSIQELPEQEATIVRRHYFEGERFDHVAGDLGISKAWVSRLHARAIRRLTRKLSGAAG